MYVDVKRVVWLLAVLAMVATACGGSSSSGSASEPADPSSNPAFEPEEPGNAPDPTAASEDQPPFGAPPEEIPEFEPPEPAEPTDPVTGGDIPAPNADWERVQSRDDLDQLRAVAIEELAWNDDFTVALVRYIGPAEPCSGSRVTLAETDTLVKFTLESGLPPDAAVISCIAAILPYEIAVPLAAPLGDRDVDLVDPADVAAPPPPDPFEGAVFPVDQYFGITEDEAIALAEIEQRELRVVARDGEFFTVTEDFRPTRVNVEIIDGVIVNAFSG